MTDPADPLPPRLGVLAAVLIAVWCLPAREARSDSGESPLDRAVVETEIARCIRAFAGVGESHKEEALRRVAGIGPVAVDPLLQAWPHLSDRSAVWVARALRELRSRRAAFPLITRFDVASTELRQEILDALAAIGDPATIPFLQTVLGEPELALRRRAATALAAFDDPRTAVGLLRAMEDEDWWVRAEAVGGLRRLADRLAALDLGGRVLAMLDRVDDAAREDAVRLLASLRDPRAVEPVAELLRLGEPDLRRMCARALGLLGDAGATRSLEYALDDEDASVRTEAARSLVVLCGERCFRTLARRLDSEPTRRVRNALRRLLRSFTGRDLGPDSEPWIDWAERNL